MAQKKATAETIGVSAAAKMLGVSPAAVRRACDAGKIRCERSSAGHRRIVAAALEDVTRDDLQRGPKVPGQFEHGPLKALVALAEAGAHWQDIDELLRNVARLLLEATGAVDCDIYRLEEEGVFRCLVSYDADGLDEEAIGTVLRTGIYDLARKALAEGDVLVVDEVTDPRLSPAERDVYAAYGFASELCIPLNVQDRVVGVVELYADHRYAFGSALEFARGAAQVVAGALEKALLYSELEDRSEVLHELFDLAGLLSQTYDVTDLLRTVARRLLSAVHATECDIYERLGDGYRVAVAATIDGFTGTEEGHWLTLAENPSTVRALAGKRALRVIDTTVSELNDVETQTLADQGLRSELCFPLLVRDEIVGFIDLFDRYPRDWQECVDFAAGVGQLVAGTLDRAALLGRLEQRNKELRTLVEGGLEFGSTLETGRVLLSIARRTRAAAAASACTIDIVEDTYLRTVVAIDEADREVASCGAEESAVTDYPLRAEALRTGRPVVVDDVTRDPRASAAEREGWKRCWYRSGVIVPLINGTRILGTMSLYGGEPRTQWPLDLLRGLSQIAGQAVANARLYAKLDRSAQRAALLNEIGVELGRTLDEGELLRTVATRLRAATDVDECAVFMYDEDGQLECTAIDVLERSLTGQTAGGHVDLHRRPVMRLVMASGRSAAVSTLNDERIDEDSREFLAAHGIKSYFIAPLIAKGFVIGAIELTEARRERSFTAEDRALVEAVCRIASLAIDHATLFGDLERRSREAELLNDIARQTTASLDLDEIADAAVRGLRRLIPIADYGLALIEDDEFVIVHGSAESRRPTAMVAQHVRGIIDRLRQDRVMIVAGDASGAPVHGHAQVLASAASAAIGLFDQAELIGVLMLGCTEPDGFAEVDSGVLERVGVHLSHAACNARLYHEIKSLHLSNLKGLSTALNAKDYYTLGHAARVAAYMALLCEELGWESSAIVTMREAAYLHDIGKIGVSDRVLLKQGPLNGEEWELMRQHPVVSAQIIQPLFDDDLVAAVRHHHERYDGAGYPSGLAGEQIPFLARAMCVVDSYDAMSLRRSYKSALTWDECRDELLLCRGSQFDPDIVDAFLRVLERLADLRRLAAQAAAEAAARIDPAAHAQLPVAPGTVDHPVYKEVSAVLREVRDAYPEIRFITTQVLAGKRCVCLVDADEPGTPDFSLPGEEIMADDEAQQTLSGRSYHANVLFVDSYGVWANGMAPLVTDDGRIVGVVVADAPALASAPTQGLGHMAAETPVSTLQEAAVRLSRAEIDAITDGLTGLYNHRYLHERLADEVDRARRENLPASVLFCDLDYFKDYNDRLGHAAGDAALRGTARILEKCTRRADLNARYGGEEFVVVLPEATTAVAREIAERIRAAVAELFGPPGGLTVSIGVATFPRAGETKEQLLEAADRAMYIAKRQGRDRVITADGAGREA